ncbi:MAG TPA: hypothetical protein PKM08_12705, partial [Syntrophorhabdaceae bacterium]|nr:hypothetical protein [Syntrophorhabdaceae bacterium]
MVENGARLIYAVNEGVEKGLRLLRDEFPHFNYELCTNEKIAYEQALSCAYASCRSACLLSSEGLYEALDPIMSSAYTGTAGGFLVICVQENDVLATPVGPFAKLPFIVADSIDALRPAVEYGYTISEKYETPVIIQAAPEMSEERGSRIEERASASPNAERRTPNAERSSARFIKDPNRWAATPQFRYRLHRQLNEKIEKIRKEFEEYEGNHVAVTTQTGVITDKLSSLEFYDEDGSILRLATLYPLPDKLVSGFIDRMDIIFVEEGYPVIELQIADRAKVRANKMQ